MLDDTKKVTNKNKVEYARMVNKAIITNSLKTKTGTEANKNPFPSGQQHNIGQ